MNGINSYNKTDESVLGTAVNCRWLRTSDVASSPTHLHVLSPLRDTVTDQPCWDYIVSLAGTKMQSGIRRRRGVQCHAVVLGQAHCFMTHTFSVIPRASTEITEIIDVCTVIPRLHDQAGSTSCYMLVGVGRASLMCARCLLDDCFV